MKVALILPSPIWFAPFIRIYTKILNDNNIDYEIISWNRDGKDLKEGIQYVDHFDRYERGVVEYAKYIRFIIKQVKENRYERIVVFTSQLSCLLSLFLLSQYKNKYILDYRDMHIEQKPIFKQIYSLLTKHSFANVVSSPGFIPKLPKSSYLISHNCNIDSLREALARSSSKFIENKTDIIDVLTIGGIRDYESNVQVIDALANKEGFTVRFVGSGPSVESLKLHTKEINAMNVSFEGYYPKEKEKEYIRTSTFLNIFYPRKLSHDTALSNRFYNSLIYKKPMITTANTTQGDYAVKFKVGVALDDCNNLVDDLKSFLQTTNHQEYSTQCDNLLREVLSDYEKFETELIAFINE